MRRFLTLLLPLALLGAMLSACGETADTTPAGSPLNTEYEFGDSALIYIDENYDYYEMRVLDEAGEDIGFAVVVLDADWNEIPIFVSVEDSDPEYFPEAQVITLVASETDAYIKYGDPNSFEPGFKGARAALDGSGAYKMLLGDDEVLVIAADKVCYNTLTDEDGYIFTRANLDGTGAQQVENFSLFEHSDGKLYYYRNIPNTSENRYSEEGSPIGFYICNDDLSNPVQLFDSNKLPLIPGVIDSIYFAYMLYTEDSVSVFFTVDGYPDSRPDTYQTLYSATFECNSDGTGFALTDESFI